MDSSKKESKERVLTIFFFFSFENYSRESRFLTGVRRKNKFEIFNESLARDNIAKIDKLKNWTKL